MNEEQDHEFASFSIYQEHCAKLNKFIAREFADVSHHDVCELLRSHIEDGFDNYDAYFLDLMRSTVEDFDSNRGDFNDWIEAAIKAWLRYHSKTKLRPTELLALIDRILQFEDDAFSDEKCV